MPVFWNLLHAFENVLQAIANLLAMVHIVGLPVQTLQGAGMDHATSSATDLIQIQNYYYYYY